MNNQLIFHLTQIIDNPIIKWTSLSGGDISNVYLLESANQKFVLKTNTTRNAQAMFQAEQDGLEKIAATNTIKTPKIFLCEIFEGTSFLLMEYIETKQPNSTDFAKLGHALGQLHQVTNHSFGSLIDNFIGSLPQSNTPHENWLDFYINQRLVPQFELAQQKQLLALQEIPSKEQLLEKGKDLFQNLQPSLLHGDLWSGNYLISTDGIPYLIDPAFYYGHSEIDIAMTRLFGGFGRSFYSAYHEIHPKNDGIALREKWYQLYYLLVHLNLFGRGYYGAVSRILKSL